MYHSGGCLVVPPIHSVSYGLVSGFPSLLDFGFFFLVPSIPVMLVSFLGLIHLLCLQDSERCPRFD